MRKQFLVSAMGFAMVATPAMAQEDDGFTGIYVGGSFGITVQSSDRGSRIAFDTNRDGTFGDTVFKTNGADAFSPGFCDGGASSAQPTNCSNDDDDIEYFGHVGYDRQMGNIVVGVVGEFGKSEATDSVSAFSDTPAFYTMQRKMKYNAGLRLRAGYTPNNTTLFYATGGGAYAKVENFFRTSNGLNSFTDNGNSNAYGWSAGGGVEQRIGSHFSFGLQYLFTDLKDDDYRVAAGRGNAPATQPFVVRDPTGTDLRRVDDRFRFHSLRATASFRF